MRRTTMTSLEDSAMADWSDPPPCGCRDTAPACSRGRGLYALAVAAYAAWEWRHDAAARAWWRRAVRAWRGHVRGEGV